MVGRWIHASGWSAQQWKCPGALCVRPQGQRGRVGERSQFVHNVNAGNGHPDGGHGFGPVRPGIERLIGIETCRNCVDRGHCSCYHGHKFQVWISGKESGSRLHSGLNGLGNRRQTNHLEAERRADRD